MNYKNFIQKLGFKPKENTLDVFIKKYADGYAIELDFEKKLINYGKKIKIETKTIQNFFPAENWVVLECVNRLLEKGYKPENIILEKTWASGHGTSGRLDICVTRDDGSEFLLIECKTYGKEFNKALARMKKDGGQLFTYFKFSNKADAIMLYASELNKKEIIYHNEIIKIENDYRAGDVKDFYDKWNKLTKDNGIFNPWVTPYNFVSKALTPKLLEPIKQEDSGFIFNRFLEILRHNVVSDKPNAFNKIFTLFLCKIYDEKTTPKNEKLKFQWIEGVDDDISFQMRLADLYKNGMYEFLEKRVTDFSISDFETKYKDLDGKVKENLLKDIIKLRLEKNNEFAIKEVFDTKSFSENAKVVKQVVELLQGFKIRYTKKQQYLSDFFELLLTTGLKQESGQFFTPVPIAQFIIKSIPIDELIDEKLQKGERNNLLPYVIDYAAGSGHFLTETMHEVQRVLDKKDASKYISDTAKKIKNWQEDHFDWALQYVYGVEKDYRLVKVGKVGCYLHGDGLANVVHSDGLGSFRETEEYKDQLAIVDTDFPKENKQFDIVVSNPPYSVSAFKQNARSYYTEKDFDLYSNLTDNSSEIECLFIERTKQLLKDGGMAGIILPSSILNNTGIYSKSREIILQNFDIVAITELGSNTFMATGTNTVILFLRRRNNYDSINLKKSVKKFFTNLKDVTLNGIEKSVSKYIAHTWEDITFKDYKTLLQKQPNKAIQQHEIYQEYQKKIKVKNEQEKWHKILKLEEEKLFYFIIAYPQQVVLVKSGEKTAEKQFLGYEFSNRRGSEGIHPIQRGKSIDECTKLFDSTVFDNPEKASTYIYKAFNGDFDFPIDESLKNNIFRTNLVDMFTFNRVDLEKNISLSTKKKVKSKWNLVRLNEVCDVRDGTHDSPKFVNVGYPLITSKNITSGKLDFTNAKNISKKDFDDINKRSLVENGDIIFAMIGTIGFPVVVNTSKKFAIKNVALFKNDKSKVLNNYYLKELLNNDVLKEQIQFKKKGSSRKFVSLSILRDLKIPLPPKKIQEKIVAEIKVLEQKEKKANNEVERLKNRIDSIFDEICSKTKHKEQLGNISKIKNGGTPNSNNPEFWDGGIPWVTLVDTKEKYLVKTVRNISEKGISKSSAVLLPINTVLFSSRATIGDVSIAKIEVATNQGYKNFICNTDKLHYEYLYYFLKREAKNIESLASGMTYPEISKTLISEYKIPLPPVSKQQKIVLKIEKIEKEITKLEKGINAISEQKETVLKKHLE